MKIGFEDFFNFDDSEPLDAGIEKMKQFIAAYKEMIAAVEASNGRLGAELGEVQSSAAGLLDTVKKLNVGMEGSEQALLGTSQASEELLKDFNALKAVEAENTKQLAAMQAELDKLTKAQEKFKDNTVSEVGSLNDLRARLGEAEKAYKAMGDATDKALKEEQLLKVRGLASEFKTANGALNDAKKGATAAAGSYNELASRVANAKKQLKEMEGGLHGNSAQFKELKKFAAEGTEQLKEWDNAVGDNQRKVGDYAGQLGGLIPGFGGVAGSIQTATTAAKGFIATPLGAVVAAIAAALASLTSYFNGSIEGQDDLNKVMKIGGAIFETLKDVAEAVGKAIFKAISEPKKLFEAFIGVTKQVWAAIKEAFENPIDTLKAFGQAILENVVSRLQGVIGIVASFKKIFTGDIAEGFKDLGNSAIQAATGVKNGIDKIVAAFEPLTNAMKERIALGLQIAEVENKLRKDRIDDILDDAKTELAVTKLLVDARNKLSFTEEERFKKLRQANQLLEEQLEGDLQLARDEIKLQQLIIQQDGETYEARQKLVELQAKEVELQSAFFKARKKRQAEEIALIREIEKETIDSAKRIVDAENALNTVRLNDQIAANKAILDEENSSLEARLEAIHENEEAQLQLLEQDKEVQLAAAKESALARIELDADTAAKIYANESISIQARIEQERKAKEALLSQDEAYGNQVIKIEEDIANKTTEVIEQTNKSVEDNVFKILARDADIALAKVNTFASEALTDLNNAFASGDIDSIRQFEQEKLAIQRQAQQDALAEQIEYLKTRAALLEEGGRERVQIEEKIAALELAASKSAADERLRNEQAVQDALKNLRQVAFDSAVTIINNLGEARDMERDEELAKIEAQFQRETELAGENEIAKAAIEKEFNEKKKKIEQEQAAANRRRAIFQKALAITEIGVNTAKGVGQALGAYVPPASFIIAAAVAAAGALQIAAVASKPIPKFATGTDDAPGGLALINEQGPELIVHKGKGYMVGSDGPTLAYIPKHAQVYTAEETERIKEAEGFTNQITGLKTGMDTVIEVGRDQGQQELIETFTRRLLSLEHTIRTKPAVHINYTKQGAEAILRNAEANTKFLSDFYP